MQCRLISTCVALFVVQYASLVRGALFVDPSSPAVTYEGRVDRSNVHQPRFDWSAVQLSISFTGSQQLQIMLSDVGNQYDVYLNGETYTASPLITPIQAAISNYTVVSGVSTSVSNTVVLRKRTEAQFGVVTFLGFYIDDAGSVLAPIPPAPYPYPLPNAAKISKLEWIGDSLSCGYGVLGIAPCEFSANTENAGVAFPSLVASYYGAELHLQCWSGKGVVRNYGSPNVTSPDPLPIFYPRAVANDNSSSWNPSQWQADAVVINLGSNDFSTQPQPPKDIFVRGYVGLVKAVLSNYPSARVYCECGPMESVPMCDGVQAAVAAINLPTVMYLDNHASLVTSDFEGCSNHPSRMGQSKLAARTIAGIEQLARERPY